MEELAIVQAEKLDLPQILQIKKESHQYFSELRPDLYCESEVLYTDELLSSFFDGKNRKISLAKMGDNIVGYAFTELLSVELPMMTKRKYIYIHDIAVRTEFQNRGIATQLLKSIENEALRAGATKLELAVHLFNDKALSVYRKKGFKERTIRMEKELI